MKTIQFKIIGILYLAYALLSLAAGIHVYNNQLFDPFKLMHIEYRISTIMYLFAFGMSLLDLVFGISLITGRKWTIRLPGYMVSIANLFMIPLGSILAVTSIIIQTSSRTTISIRIG